jgi:hypothetical protein
MNESQELSKECPQQLDIPARQQRRKLWELDGRMHCPVIGTCLSIEDLKRVMRQSGIVMKAKASDFDYHVTLVHASDKKSRAAKNLQKLLDRRFGRHIKKVSKMTTEQELSKHWQQALEEDEIPGMLWAIITHPALSRSLSDRVYGEVHMLSHLSGQSHRKALARIPLLEAERDELKTTLKKQRAISEGQLGERDKRIKDLESLTIKLRQELTSGEIKQESPDTVALNESLARLRRHNDKLTINLATTRQELDEQSAHVSAIKELLDETREQLSQSENNLELLLEHFNGNDKRSKGVPNLAGRKVVYIGGRRSLAPHLRSVVEGCYGSFIHHDGGLEESRANLDTKLTGADVVFCPIDCISHDACKRVKRSCKRNNTQFIPLRSSGVSSLLNGLHLLAEQSSQSSDSLPEAINSVTK